MVWGKAGSTTKTSASQLLDVTVSSNENNMMLRHIISSGNTAVYYRFNSDTGSNYAYGWSENGGAKSNSASQSRILYDTGGDAGDKFDIGYICNLSSEEKLIIGFQINEDISGAGNAPVRGKGVFKWANTSDSITSINNFNTDQSGNYDTDSNMSVLGSDVTPIAAVPAVGANLQNGSRFEETDTRKMYNLSELTFDDNFSTDKGWVSSGVQAKIDSNGYLLYDEDSDGNPHKIYYDIGTTLSDTKWLWRFKITTNTFTMNTDPTPQIVYIRISDNTDHRGSSNNEDAIGFSYRTSDGNQKYIRTTYSDGAIFGTTSNFSTQIATGTHYVQITRDSSTQFTVKLYSDSSYSTLVESKSITIPSTITSLRYLKIDNIDSDGTSNGRLIFHIDDMELYSGVNNISDTDYDKYWEEIGA